jgi:hypothetical protein
MALSPVPDPRPDRRFSPPVALWCPYCRQSFVGTVDRGTGRFVHGTCPVGRLDLDQIRELARTEWFWARFLDKLRVAGPARAQRSAGHDPGPKAA